MKYAPEGERGLALGANAGYDPSDVARYCRESNEATLVLPKIESPAGVRNAEAIMDVEGVDGVVFGPGDLSAKMGLHGEWEHPKVLAALEGVVSAALERVGRRASGHAGRQALLRAGGGEGRPHLRRNPAQRVRSAERGGRDRHAPYR